MEENLTIYFGYGSNLWLEQMSQRCPSSKFLGIARLDNYRWMINNRGYANVVEVSDQPSKRSAADATAGNHSYGFVYSLSDADEAALDGYEGVPDAYTKEILQTIFWPKRNDGEPVDLSTAPKKVHMLVYIDRKRTEDALPKDEYDTRMNNGIRDAEKEGVPKAYIDAVMRRFIPEQSSGME